MARETLVPVRKTALFLVTLCHRFSGEHMETARRTDQPCLLQSCQGRDARFWQGLSEGSSRCQKKKNFTICRAFFPERGSPHDHTHLPLKCTSASTREFVSNPSIPTQKIFVHPNRMARLARNDSTRFATFPCSTVSTVLQDGMLMGSQQ